MTLDQIILFILLLLVFIFLIWGRWRYDLVAFAALSVAVIAQVVPADQAFAGFGHPATVIVALVLVVSRALSNSGVVEWIARHATSASRGLTGHIGLLGSVAAALSAVMNNVAALAMLMPVDVQAAKKAGRSPALTLMPLSFASILGGMITLIGTPPNIIVSQYRETAIGTPFAMFDYAPVGVICAVAGILFVTLVGWRLIPQARVAHDSGKELLDIAEYVAEVAVPEDSPVVGKRVRDLDAETEEAQVTILGVVRNGRRIAGMARLTELRPKDVLVIEAAPEAIEQLIGTLKLEYVRHQSAQDHLAGDKEDLALVEVVVPENARIARRSAFDLRLLARHDVTLLGVSRRGKRFRESVRKLVIEPGDILLLLGPVERLPEVVAWLGCLPLAERGITVLKRDKALLSVGIFAAAILLATLGVLDLAVALAGAVVLLVALNVVPLRELYESVEWPVVVLLGSLIPIGAALESTGGTTLIAAGILGLAEGLSPVVILAILMAITMSLSDVMNNTATAVIAAPIAVEIAARLEVNPDPFLMSVAVAASCAFLTPIGHKNNTLILGPGGYRFGDYWRMGLPLEVLVIAAGVPAILWVWPL